jgi:hypothetical protein
MGGSSSTQNQSITTYNKQTNSININASNNLLNSAVMSSIKKSLVQTQQSCKQSFESNALLQISNLMSSDTINLNNLTLNAESVVKLECVTQSQLQSQTEDNFLSDNASAMTTMLQSAGTSEFIQGISGTLKSKVDSMPLGFSNTSSNTNATNIIDNNTATNIMQNIQNLYQSTSVNETTLKSVSDIYQSFVSETKLIVNNLSAGGDINISAINLNTIQNFDATAKLASAISNVIIQKMQSILGMKIEFTGSTSQSSSTSQTSKTQGDNSTTNESVSNVANNAINVANNAIKGITSVFNTPKVILVAGIIGFVIVAIIGLSLFFFTRKKVGNGIEIVDKLINAGNNFIQDDTLTLIKNYI